MVSKRTSWCSSASRWQMWQARIAGPAICGRSTSAVTTSTLVTFGLASRRRRPVASRRWWDPRPRSVPLEWSCSRRTPLGRRCPAPPSGLGSWRGRWATTSTSCWRAPYRCQVPIPMPSCAWLPARLSGSWSTAPTSRSPRAPCLHGDGAAGDRPSRGCRHLRPVPPGKPGDGWTARRGPGRGGPGRDPPVRRDQRRSATR